MTRLVSYRRSIGTQLVSVVSKNTFKEVRKVDPSITIGQVKAWIEKNTHREANLTGFNSYVLPGPKHEYQIDPFFPQRPERRGATEIQDGVVCH